jgi:16S rRNA C1402 N4-methylase RsmH
MPRLTAMAHDLTRPVLRPGSIAIDATVGNGHDTLFLANCVGTTGRVFGFDVQSRALAAAAARLAGYGQVTLVHAGHEAMRAHLPAEIVGRIDAIMFNLGYLPGSDKSIVTCARTTLAGLAQALDLLAPGGRITLILYPAHTGGAEEAAAVKVAAARLSKAFSVGRLTRLGTAPGSPELIVIERIR